MLGVVWRFRAGFVLLLDDVVVVAEKVERQHEE